MKKSEVVAFLKELVREQLTEMSTTGAVGAYQTPFAFSKGKKDNRAVKTMKSFGYSTVERPKRPSSTKLVDYKQ